MAKQLVFVHGRAQEGKDSIKLKHEWIDAFSRGLAKSNLELPIDESNIRFPYYGDTLFQLAEGTSIAEASDIIVRGLETNESLREFISNVLTEIRKKEHISQEDVDLIKEIRVIERGFQNWGWVQDILRAIDLNVPGASSESIAIAFHDVYQYLYNEPIQEVIDAGVLQALSSSSDNIVVSHSLGTIVTYRILQDQAFSVPLLVTLGSPLALTAVKEKLGRLRVPQCTKEWFNAMDPHDVVSLYPLDTEHFPISEGTIQNKTDVRNMTSNKHGIAGYLSDKDVAQRIYNALK